MLPQTPKRKGNNGGKEKLFFTECPLCVHSTLTTAPVGNGDGISKLISENTEGSAQAPQLPRKKDKRDFPVSTAGAQTLFITHILFTDKNQGTRVEHGGVPASPEAEEESLELRSLRSWSQHEDSASFICIERWLLFQSLGSGPTPVCDFSPRDLTPSLGFHQHQTRTQCT